ncbi:MAG: hypothetical protein KGI04_00035 [Candidatus Micrarchaeota archaeon]|nr:hypothetical protein [Candidatus Micrarchaeota archaeon]
MLKSQSAMEYLLTYSWALLIISVVLVALFALGVFNPGNVVSSQCILPAGLSCINVYLVSNGLVTINLLQATLTPINLTAYGCNSNQTINHMYVPSNPPSNQIKMQIGGNYTFSVQCWAGGSQYSATPGSAFQGYISVNYIETNTGFPHTVIGQLTAKVS